MPKHIHLYINVISIRNPRRHNTQIKFGKVSNISEFLCVGIPYRNGHCFIHRIVWSAFWVIAVVQTNNYSIVDEGIIFLWLEKKPLHWSTLKRYLHISGTGPSKLRAGDFLYRTRRWVHSDRVPQPGPGGPYKIS